MLGTNRMVLHLRFDGRSNEVYLDELELEADSTDSQILRAVEIHFNLPANSLADYVVARTSRAIIVRPEAIYG